MCVRVSANVYVCYCARIEASLHKERRRQIKRDRTENKLLDRHDERRKRALKQSDTIESEGHAPTGSIDDRRQMR